MRCNINNNSNFDITEIEDLLQDLFSFSQNRHGFKKPVTLNLMSDEANTSPLGKTAHYDPSTMEIVVYVDGRHPKDIMRSFSHELVHHNQNENGMFDNVAGESGDGYAQSNPHLRKMEKEAYLQGNMCFRDWEDGYKSSNPNILNERRIYKMSTKDWKDKELNGLLNERWGFSMDLGKLNESNCNSAGKKDDEKCSHCEGKGCPHCAAKNEEEVNEINIRSSLGGPEAPKSDKEAAKEIQQGAKNIHTPKVPLSRAQTPNLKKEGKESLEDMARESFKTEEEFDEAIKMLKKLKDALRKKSPPKSGGNSGSGAPAQPSMQERKLRESIRRIIRKELSTRPVAKKQMSMQEQKLRESIRRIIRKQLSRRK